MAIARISVFDRHGAALGELDGQIGATSWRLNRVGKSSITIAKSDIKATRTMFQFYNRVLIEFDNGLPAWGGVMVPPRRWGPGTITANLADGGELLHYRMTDHGRYFEATPAGTIMQRLLDEANAVAETGALPGSIWTGGPGRYKDYHYEDLLNAAEVLAQYTGTDFSVAPVMDGSTLAFVLDWFEERGMDRPGVVLMEGHNVEVSGFEEPGPIINRWAGVGEGATWSTKARAERTDVPSWGTYGLREAARVFAGVVEQTTLDQNVEELLEETREARPRVQLEAVDLSPARFSSYDVGDRIWVQLYTYGFAGDGLGYDHAMRVLAREFDPTTGRCALVVEESEFKA